MSSSFTIPPLPAGPLLSVKEVARRAGCSEQAVYLFIHGGRLAAVKVAGRLVVAESTATSFIETWPSSNRGVSARWADYRAYKRSQAVAQPIEAMAP
jgi:excisionase family DNA binding protein